MSKADKSVVLPNTVEMGKAATQTVKRSPWLCPLLRAGVSCCRYHGAPGKGGRRAQQWVAEPSQQLCQPRCLGTARCIGGLPGHPPSCVRGLLVSRSGYVFIMPFFHELAFPLRRSFLQLNPICRIVSMMQMACLSLP